MVRRLTVGPGRQFSAHVQNGGLWTVEGWVKGGGGDTPDLAVLRGLWLHLRENIMAQIMLHRKLNLNF
jgi:hypothetical protein